MASPGGTAVAVERELRAALAESTASSHGSGSLAEWAESLAALRRVVDVATAAQEHAMARLAAVEVEVAEDGTVRETHRTPGHVSVDAAAVVSGALVTTAVHAERRVRAAVERAGDGAWTGLGGLHEAMAAGRLDGYRADVVADELEEAPPQVRAAVVAAVQEHLDEDGPRLRRRCRRLLARISPDLVRQRARRARAECRLERWVAEPGVDTWHGTFPSEEAALAWAAIDALAQRYVTDGVVESVDRARAKALTDLVTGNATISTDLVLTVPAGNVPAGKVTAGKVTVGNVTEGDGQDGLAVTLADRCEAVAGAARTALGEGGAVDAPADTAHARAAMIPGHDRCPVAAEEARTAHPDDLVEVGGPRPSAPLLVPRAWVDRLTRAAADAAAVPGGSRRGRRRLQVRSCHPVTGALLPDPTDRADPTDRMERADPTDAVSRGDVADARDPVAPFDRADGADPGAADRDPGPYRPPARLTRLVRARDGQCRFPGCHVAARFCDLDHARPWPAGPTTAENLLCLCRRHHRVKQRPGWRLRLTGDATATWTDPTGRTRVTAPRDALHPVVLPHSPDEPDHTPGTPRLDLPRGPHSALEFVLEHHLARRRTPAPAPRLHHSSRGHPTDPPPF